MKHTIKKLLMPVIALAAVTLGACSDWTETKSLDINYPSLETQNPALYQKYLAALRDYKAGDHKITFVTMPGKSTVPEQQNDHLTNMPDSVDYICLIDPANLHPTLVKEIQEVHKKGTRVVYDIDYDAIEQAWKKLLEEEEANKPEVPEETAENEGEGGNPEGGEGEQTPEQLLETRFLEFCKEHTSAQLLFCDQFNFDGIVFSYKGRAPESMNDPEKAIYTTRQTTFLSLVDAWYTTHSDKLLFFQGNPQNLIDMTILSKSKYIIIPALTAASGDLLSQKVLMAAVEGVPTDRFIIGVTTPSLVDPTNMAGYFSAFEADGKTQVRAVKGAAQWAVVSAGKYTKAGVSVAQAQNDYYNLTLVYKNIREAIDIMNPSPKN